MANFTIQMVKPDIIAHSVEYERKKFADILAVQPDAINNTKSWLLAHVDVNTKIPPNVDYNAFIRSISKRAFTDACIDLLDWDYSKKFPEVTIFE